MGFIFLGIGMYYISTVLNRINKKDQEKEISRMPYKLRSSIFNASEKAFYLELKKQMEDKYEIFTKVRIIDFIEVPKGSRNYSKWRNKIWAKHVDFLLCDKELRPVIAIELDGKSHLKKSRLKRDGFVKSVYEKVGVNFKVMNVGDSFYLMVKNVENL